jgi:aspartate kinase
MTVCDNEPRVRAIGAGAMRIIVQKFGGTSVGNAERLENVVDIIAKTLEDRPVIAVVSARSGTSKAEGTTSLLLAAAANALAGTSFEAELALIASNHGRNGFVHRELEKLRGFLSAISVIKELSPRSQDNVLAVGERLSAYLLARALEARNVKARFVDLSTVVPEGEGQVDPVFFRRLQGRLAELCKPDGDVPVVTGFFGMVPGGLLSAVGRGYTDFTAAMIAAGLGDREVEEMQVWKEVDGIFTTDPRKVASARVLPRISPAEAAELTYFGSEVLHPFTMERVVAANVPIRIKNTFHPERDGTVIAPYGAERPPGHVTAVTAKRGICSLTITSNRMFNAHGFLARVFSAFERHGVVVDLVSTSEVSISCTIEKLQDAEHARADLEQLGSVHISQGRAIVALVGEGMKFSLGTAGKMFATLGAAGVNVEMISQGASEMNISCVVDEKDAARGVEAIHEAFALGG